MKIKTLSRQELEGFWHAYPLGFHELANRIFVIQAYAQTQAMKIERLEREKRVAA